MLRMKVEELDKLLNASVKLRNVNETMVSTYADRMTAGVEFPPVILGRYPKSEKYGDSAIIDGVHRITAAKAAGLKDLRVDEIHYKTLTEALADMYVRNMAHGLPVTEGQRNARITLLRAQGMKLEQIAKLFGLGKSSIDRIVKGTQGEGKSGLKTGTKRSAAHKDLEPLKPKTFFNYLDRINTTIQSREAYNALENYCMPEGDEDCAIAKLCVESIQRTIGNLQVFVKGLI